MERLAPLLNPKLQHPLEGAENLNYIQNMHHAKELSQTLCVYVRVLYRLHNQDYAYLYSRSHTYTTAYSDLQVYMSGFFLARLPFIDFGQSQSTSKFTYISLLTHSRGLDGRGHFYIPLHPLKS